MFCGCSSQPIIKVERRSIVRIPVKKGLLTKFGYDAKSPMKSRRKSLNKACKEYGALSCYKKLNALVTFNKNKSPKLSAKFKKDLDWIKKKCETNKIRVLKKV
jgi:hypothetical protein